MATTTERGYGKAHQAERRRYAAVMKRHGGCVCARCGRWILASQPWDLGHNPYDRGTYLGPLHVRCNRDTRLEKALRRGLSARAAARAWL